MSVITLPDEKVDVSEFISPFRYSWKNFLCYGNQIKSIWKKNNFSEEFNKSLFILNNNLYRNLKEYEKGEDSHMRKENKILENQINSDYQKILFDFLYEQQDLYNDYDIIFRQSLNYTNLKLRDHQHLNEKPKIFPKFILNFNDYLIQFKKNSKLVNELQKIRWYLAFDVINTKDKDGSFSLFKKRFNFFQNLVGPKKEIQNKDPFDFSTSFFETTINENYYTDDSQDIILTKELINQFIKGERNELIYVLKLLNLTITFYCQFIMNYLYTTYKEKKYELIKEYNKRFQNYINCAVYIDHLCENINVATNYIYEIICPDYPIFPKFSVFRLFMKTWFREMSSNINEFDSFFSFFKLNISGIYSNFLSKDLDQIKQMINIPPKCKSGYEETVNSTVELSTSTKPSVTSNLTSVTNTGINVSVICPFGSLYEDNSICYSIIELALNSIYDSFVNEYSVYSLNLTTIETNRVYEDLEDNFADIIESQIKNVFHKLVIEEQIVPYLVIEALIKHFKSTFYSNRILKKLKSTIYNKVYLILTMLLYNEIKKQFCQYIEDSNPSNIKEFKAIGYLELNVIDPDKKDVVIQLIDECKSYLISDKVKEYLAVTFLKENSKKSENFVKGLQLITEWYIKEEKKFNTKNKQVNKELVSKNFPTFCDFQKTLLSISDHVPWSKIESIKGMLQKFDPIITDSYYNINEDLPLNGDYTDDLQIKPPW